MDDQSLVAVVTGDVRKSTELPDEQRRNLAETLREAFGSVSETFALRETPLFSMSRGDSWQFYLPQWEMSLEFLLSFLATLAKQRPSIRSRASLAVDTIDFLSDRDIGESDGKAFRRSGRGLEELGDDMYFNIQVPRRLDNVFHLCSESFAEVIDLALHDWTAKQARAVAGMLEVERRRQMGEDATQKSIAQSWKPDPVTAQTVQKHLKRGHWYRIGRELERFRQFSVEIQKRWEP